MKFTKLWDDRPYWPSTTSDKQMARYYYNKGFEYCKELNIASDKKLKKNANNYKPNCNFCGDFGSTCSHCGTVGTTEF